MATSTYQAARNGVVFGRPHYERMGRAAAEYRRQERLLLGRPAWVLRRERRRVDALLYGRDARADGAP